MTIFYDTIYFDKDVKDEPVHLTTYQGDQVSRGLKVYLKQGEHTLNPKDFTLTARFLDKKQIPFDRVGKKKDNYFLLELPSELFETPSVNKGQLTLKREDDFVLSMQPIIIDVLESLLYKSAHDEVETKLTMEDIQKVKVHHATRADELTGVDIHKELAKKLEKDDLKGLDVSIDLTPIEQQLKEKVDKVQGKGLSTNDFTDEAQQKLANLTAIDLSTYAKKSYVDTAIENIDFPVVKDGKDGVSEYVFIAYSENADGSGMTEKPTPETKYIGFAVMATDNRPPYTFYYDWHLFVGKDGKDGKDAEPVDLSPIHEKINKKQDQLIEGENITIRHNVISAVGSSGGSLPSHGNWIIPTLQNGLEGIVKYRLRNDGDVQIVGQTQQSTVINNKIVFQLPEKYRPKNEVLFPIVPSGNNPTIGKLEYNAYNRGIKIWNFVADASYQFDIRYSLDN